MSDIFISYARSTATEAQAVAEGLRALGYGVWRDDELPAHRAYGEVIEERLRSAKAVVVIWSAEAVKSQWVRSEADRARLDDKLVQLSLDGAALPMPFDQIQCADLTGWSGDADAPGWRKVVASVADLAGARRSAVESPAAATRKLSICVLPFANMSGDPEQEYFCDGISEDIITDLSKVSALFVISRNSSFRFKGQHVDLPKVARELEVSHVLEGSVRKAGARVRITAQLIDGETGGHVWAERWDRDLTDIFALQDEISEAIVSALKLKLLPEEIKAIERRGTNSVEAYNLVLMARRYYSSGNHGNIRMPEAIIGLCRAAIDIDPGYAEAWALLANAQGVLHYLHTVPGDDGAAAAKQALALDPNLAEAHAVVAQRLVAAGEVEAGRAELAIALRLDPQSHTVNRIAAYTSFRDGRWSDAIGYFEKAAALADGDFAAPGMLITCYHATGDLERWRASALMCLARAEIAVQADPANGSALCFGACALAALGEAEKTRDWIRRALVIDPDNRMMRYNLGCALSRDLNDVDGALELIRPHLENGSPVMLQHVKIDPDLDPLRDDPRFQAMIAAAEARLAAAGRDEGAERR